MSIEYTLYVINLLANVKVAMQVICGITSILSVFFISIHFTDAYDKYEENDPELLILKKSTKQVILIMIMSSIFTLLIPSKTTMYLIALARHSKQSDIPEKVIKAIEMNLDEVIKEKGK